MTTSSAPTLLDANILVYADQAEDEHHAAAKAIRDLGQQGVFLSVSLRRS